MKDTTIVLSPAMRARTAQGFTADGDPASLWDLPTFAGAGAIRSTAKDMAKFIAANMHLIKTDLADVIDVSHKPQRDASPKMKVALRLAYFGGFDGRYYLAQRRHGRLSHLSQASAVVKARHRRLEQFVGQRRRHCLSFF
jgi:CubicO group peptidase (beta-lactamase class C family)